ncbi:MAG TPA: NAD(P)H-binding protein [Cyclobacteriaceae bacterium]
MKIILFGASRGTGLYAARLAAEFGHEVTAVARTISPAQFGNGAAQAGHAGIRVIHGDVLKPSTFENEIPGKDVVISSIGVSNTRPTTLYSRGTTNIIAAMLKYNVPRLICVSGVGVEVTPGMSLPMKALTKFLVQPLLRNNFQDLLKMEHVVKQSDLNWTIVRAPRLTNGRQVERYRYAAKDYLRNPLTISRSDLAHFIVTNIDNSACFCSRVEVAY